MDKTKFNNIDIYTIMQIAQTGNSPKKIGGYNIRKEEKADIILDWMKDIDLKEGPVKVLSSELYSAFQDWNKTDTKMDIKMFGRIMSKLLRKVRGNKGQTYFCNKNPKKDVTDG